jgi:hypothetical protein
MLKMGVNTQYERRKSERYALNKTGEGFGYAAIAASIGKKPPRAAFLTSDRPLSNILKVYMPAFSHFFTLFRMFIALFWMFIALFWKFFALFFN